jgi:hypothetical protein
MRDVSRSDPDARQLADDIVADLRMDGKARVSPLA